MIQRPSLVWKNWPQAMSRWWIVFLSTYLDSCVNIPGARPWYEDTAGQPPEQQQQRRAHQSMFANNLDLCLHWTPAHRNDVYNNYVVRIWSFSISLRSVCLELWLLLMLQASWAKLICWPQSMSTSRMIIEKKSPTIWNFASPSN